MMEFVNWKDDIPHIMDNKKCSKPPTGIGIDVNNMMQWNGNVLECMDMYGNVMNDTHNTIHVAFQPNKTHTLFVIFLVVCGQVQTDTGNINAGCLTEEGLS